MEKIKNHYVYYSYEQFGRGYIGYRKCPKCLTPETDNYFGSFTDKSFKPTEKIILFQDLTKEEAIEIEIKLHAFYNIDKNDHFANKAKQKSVGFSFAASRENHPNYGKTGEDNHNYGKKWYNNGIKDILISPDEEIPEGYILGKLPFSKETKRKQSVAMKGENNPNYGKKCYNNGMENKYFSPDEEIPEGFVLGILEETKQKLSEAMKGENNPNFGKKCYNNGVEHRYFSPEEEIPEGFILGIKEEIGGNHSKAMKGENNPSYGKKWYNNGIKDILISPDEEIPKGYFLGMKGESRRKQSEAQKIRVIISSCCYFSVKDAIDELGISSTKFKKLFEKDPITGFYVEKI